MTSTGGSRGSPKSKYRTGKHADAVGCAAAGLSGERRNQARAAVLALRGAWSGALVVGATTHLVVGQEFADPNNAKVRVAMQHNLPLVSTGEARGRPQPPGALQKRGLTVHSLPCRVARGQRSARLLLGARAVHCQAAPSQAQPPHRNLLHSASWSSNSAQIQQP